MQIFLRALGTDWEEGSRPATWLGLGQFLSNVPRFPRSAELGPVFPELRGKLIGSLLENVCWMEFMAERMSGYMGKQIKQMHCSCYMWKRGQITPILKLFEHDARVQSAGLVSMHQDLCVWGLRWESEGCWECPEDTLNQKLQTTAGGLATCFCKWSYIRTQPHPFLTCCFWLLSAIMAELSGCNRDHMMTSLNYLLTSLPKKSAHTCLRSKADENKIQEDISRQNLELWMSQENKSVTLNLRHTKR